MRKRPPLRVLEEKVFRLWATLPLARASGPDGEDVAGGLQPLPRAGRSAIVLAKSLALPLFMVIPMDREFSGGVVSTEEQAPALAAAAAAEVAVRLAEEGGAADPGEVISPLVSFALTAVLGGAGPTGERRRNSNGGGARRRTVRAVAAAPDRESGDKTPATAPPPPPPMPVTDRRAAEGG